MYDRIKIFYDGTQLSKYASLPYIAGFTTNTVFMADAKERNYKHFYEQNKGLIHGRCLSLQVFSDDDSIILEQARTISQYGDNIFVKIPLIKSNGDSNIPVIEKLLQENYKLNITAVYTVEQIKSLYPLLCNIQGDVIVSIFAGRISDTGRNPCDTVKFASTLLPNIAILWAGCKEVLSIQHAIDCGCKIITVPDTILDRMSRVGRDLTELSKETVATFNKYSFDLD